MSGPLGIPLALLTDSYKTTHVYLYPDVLKMTAYGEFRQSYGKDSEDSRILFYGIRYIIENYVAIQYTKKDVDQAAEFFATHNAGATPFPFPKDLFMKFVQENNGYFPVRIKSLPEGSVIYPHTPVYEVTAEKEYGRLVTYLETILTMIWYPTTVATLSRRCHTIIKESYEKTVDAKGMWSLDSRLHDFGFRGCTTVEQSVVGGVAHLINFSGTDTMTAAWYAQYKLNNGKPVGYSIPATEHSIMTAFKNEKLALTHLLEMYGAGVCACVMDSYDYTFALEKILPSVSSLKVEKGGFLVLRPDSGDPVQVVLQALQYEGKVVRGAGVIQGDGININTIREIATAVKEAGFSAQCVAYGMGGGLLQKVNRDTMSFATKLSHITYANGESRNVMKNPVGAKSKRSLPGNFAVYREGDGVPVVYPFEVEKRPGVNELVSVYDHGKVIQWDDFTTVRERANRQWSICPKAHNPISSELSQKIEDTVEMQKRLNKQD